METCINLDSLSLKEKSKEYKKVRKELESKDAAIKSLAIQKVSNFIYLSEGECFTSLIKAIKFKKVL